MRFETERIRLRKMTTEDAAIYHKWRNDPDVMRTTAPLLDVYRMEETEEFVQQVILGSPSSKCYFMIEKQSEKPIGVISLINIDYKNRNAECIIDIGEKAAWGKGYGTEAMKLLLDYGFLEMNLHRISLRVFSFNSRAIKLYEKLGFQQEGRSREAIFRDGAWHDIIHMAILQRDYVEERRTGDRRRQGL
ncbi:UDP-4-amino-4,6-dideoxy-N-acetyl-beta-L-altrosamine N-acetyltransferase [Planifilum fimeticola]|jgi:UDP-4-amino-4,6-dideoxy-N-acetyl-beta-L-altrosamine N-acetyltransferase|uniref:UDP-4-amino-4, 6-dideoxy-N-acetyl-beta-L-altrosamine N-acetyltransferase n=1 Tax=Planifilum fimeticola TaxID=201975 RepID=A0A2T0LAV2_9BACL|nr:GNAT family protein [Planifilum fimeticola]PRX38978.1 UDP-4-amino-4,6-dideoxy-N-acetyl-beta-L-altrosamine N-acetyltransferase [Planifilum fimeticola]